MSEATEPKRLDLRLVERPEITQMTDAVGRVLQGFTLEPCRTQPGVPADKQWMARLVFRDAPPPMIACPGRPDHLLNAAKAAAILQEAGLGYPQDLAPAPNADAPASDHKERLRLALVEAESVLHVAARDIGEWCQLADAQRAAHEDPDHAPLMPTKRATKTSRTTRGHCQRLAGQLRELAGELRT